MTLSKAHQCAGGRGIVVGEAMTPHSCFILAATYVEHWEWERGNTNIIFVTTQFNAVPYIENESILLSDGHEQSLVFYNMQNRYCNEGTSHLLTIT